MQSMDDLLGVSPAIAALRAEIEQLLERGQRRRLPPLLLQGETGTGKGLLAGLIHRCGPRSNGPFVDVSCAAIPDALLEAELFGFERGAFTDARQAKPGLLHAAHRGTFFLDEVALLSEGLQAKLLKVMEEQTVRRLGATRADSVDVQVIAASNDDLAAAARTGKFRSDLYHRLAVVTLALPPLRERREDILLLAEHFLSRACADYALQPPPRLAPDARAALQSYQWPGNVRELGNVIERAVLLAEGSSITAAMLRLPLNSSTDPPIARSDAQSSSFDDRVASVEREQLLSALNDTGWNISLAAIRLGISRNRLRYRIEKLGLRAARDLLDRERRPARRNQQATPPFPGELPATTATVGDLPNERRHLALLRAELAPVEATGPLTDLARVISMIAEKIRSFGGRVQECSDLAVVGAFGLEPAENTPNCAAYAALAIQKAAERARRVDAEVPGIKIAIYAAQLMVARVNGIAQIDLEEGRATQVALSALSQIAQTGSILISATAAPFLERRFELSRDRSVDGCAGPNYRLMRLESTGFGLGALTLAPFIGRQRELAVVGDQLAQAERKHGQIVAVVGEPGVGKSRFAYELTLTDRIRRWKVLSCRAVSYGVSTPSLPVVELLKGHFQIDDTDTPSQIRAKVTGKVVHPDARLEPHLPAVFALLDVLDEDPQWLALEPLQRRQRTIAAVKQVLLQESLARPLLVIFEDLHWIDTETQGLLDSLVEALPAERLLLLVTYRPEYQHRWASKTYYTQLRLDSLPADSTAELLGALLGQDPGLDALKQMLVKRGNPFFLEETLRTLLETGALVGARAAYLLTRPVEALQIPATVQTILAARIDRLPPEEKQLLQTASVIGKDVSYAILKGVAGQPEQILRQGLAHLQEAEFLYETHGFPELKHTFKHALTHEVTYGSLLPERRRQLHAQIVVAIEQLYADRLAEHVERLAYHATRGQLWNQAVRYSRQAGNRALDRSALREACVCFDQARTALRELPDSRERTEQDIDLCFDQYNALWPLGEFARVGEVQGEARAMAEELGDQRRLGRVLCILSHIYGLSGENARATEAAQSARAIADELGELGLRVIANYWLGHVAWFAGDPRRAAEPLRVVVALTKDVALGVRSGMGRLPGVLARYVLAMVEADVGQFNSAIAIGEEGLRISQAAGYPSAEMFARWGLGYVHLRRGDFVAATRVMEPSLALCREMEFRVPLPFVAASLGSAYLWSGRAADAVALLEEAVEAIAAMQIPGASSWVVPFLVEAYLMLGRIAEARAQAERSVALVHSHQARGWEAMCLKLLGDVHAHEAVEVDQVEAERAVDAYRQALARATEFGMRPLVAHCRFALGKLCARTHQREEATQHLTAAIPLYREMDMQFWLEQADAELKGLV